MAKSFSPNSPPSPTPTKWTGGWQLCYNLALTLVGCWYGRSHLGGEVARSHISGDAIHLKVRDVAPPCCQVKVSLVAGWKRTWAVTGGGDAPRSSTPASFTVQLDWAELSAESLCAVISCTGKPRPCLLQVHDWCMMMYMTDAISHREKASSVSTAVCHWADDLEFWDIKIEK